MKPWMEISKYIVELDASFNYLAKIYVEINSHIEINHKVHATF